MDTIITIVVPLVVGFALNEWSHRRSARSAEAAVLGAEHRLRQVELLEELRETVLKYGRAASAHLWAGWSGLNADSGSDANEDLDSLDAEQESLALRLFALCAEVDDPWIRHRVDYLEERARWAVVEPGKHFLAGGETSLSVQNVLADDHDLDRRVILINNLIGERLLAMTGGRRLPDWPSESPQSAPPTRWCTRERSALPPQSMAQMASTAADSAGTSSWLSGVPYE